MNVGVTDAILDVGGTAESWEDTRFAKNVTIVNLLVSESDQGPCRWVRADACRMDAFRDRQFDVAFSNSVIEHVGDLARQRQMADEIRRVAKRYWVQTPYRHFPIETHFVFPFFQYLPERWRRAIARHWPLSWSAIFGLDPEAEAGFIRLLGRREMRTLFPGALLERETWLGLTKSLIAFHPQDSDVGRSELNGTARGSGAP